MMALPMMHAGVDRRGSAMVLVLVAVALALVLGLSFLSRASTVVGTSQTLAQHAQARQVAESGMAMAIHYVDRNWNWRGQRSTGVWLDEYEVAGGRVTVDAEFTADPRQPLVLRAVGRVGEASHMARAGLRNPIHAFGAVVGASISVTNTGDVDGFDSSLGPYGPENNDDQATLSTNAINAGAVTVDNNSMLHGNVYVGYGGDPTHVISNPDQVTGLKESLATEVELPAPAPAPSDVGVMQSPIAIAGETMIIEEDGYYQSVTLGNGAVLRIEGDVEMLVEEDFELDNESHVVITEGSRLRLYVRGKSVVNGQSQMNTEGADPTRLIVYGLSDGVTHQLRHQSQVYAIYDMPTAELAISQKAQLFGVFMGDSLSVNNTAYLHVDRNPALLEANPRLPAMDAVAPEGHAWVMRWSER